MEQAPDCPDLLCVHMFPILRGGDYFLLLIVWRLKARIFDRWSPEKSKTRIKKKSFCLVSTTAHFMVIEKIPFISPMMVVAIAVVFLRRLV
jgi:hypothetical protein